MKRLSISIPVPELGLKDRAAHAKARTISAGQATKAGAKKVVDGTVVAVTRTQADPNYDLIAMHWNMLQTVMLADQHAKSGEGLADPVEQLHCCVVGAKHDETDATVLRALFDLYRLTFDVAADRPEITYAKAWEVLDAVHEFLMIPHVARHTSIELAEKEL
jgi:hypothetical protein